LQFAKPLIQACFQRREKRFFIHATTPDGTEIVAHTNNTGRMTGCLFPQGTIWLSPADNPARKLKWSLEITETPDKVRVGVNTALANQIVAEAITDNLIPQLSGWQRLRREVTYGSRKSRIDILLESDQSRVWVEVKNLSLVEQQHGRFPDAPTTRGQKHLLELMEMVSRGDRAALVFCCQRVDAQTLGPADDIDPEYGRLLREAADKGVEIYGLGCRVAPEGIVATTLLPIKL